jgi:pimeloyl-ACP methyl ester carboxylesterase
MRPRATAALAATSVLAAGATAVAAGRYAVDAVLRPPRSRASAGRRVLPAGFGGPPLTVHATGEGTVTLTRSLTSLLPGTYGLTGRGVRAVAGPVVEGEPEGGRADTVVRRLQRVTRGELTPGATVWLTPQVYAGGPAEALGLESAEVEVEGELGPLPAWFVPGYRDTCVIALHGLGATREQPMALLPFYASRRFPVLGLGYRGDPQAPWPTDGVRHLAGTEWHDVEAAIRYAMGRGAVRVILHGWSSGATMALRAASELSPRVRRIGENSAAGRISGLVLDSPVLDWRHTLRALAAARHIPRPLVPLAVRAAQGRSGMRADQLMRVADPYTLEVPTMLVHGPDDAIASWSASQRFAAAREELITSHMVPRAPHAAMWNADPEGYEEALRRFVTPLM